MDDPNSGKEVRMSDPKSTEFRDEIDEKLDEINKMYDDVSLWERLKILFVGLKSPRKSKEYKEAMIEMQRLSAPVSAVLIPVLAVLVLFLMSSTQTEKDAVIQTMVLEAEKLEELEKPDEIEPPEEQEMDVEVDINVDAPTTQVETPTTQNQPQTPTPQTFDSVIQVKSPVVLQDVYGQTRSVGTRGASLKRFGGDKATEDAVMRALRWLKKRQNKDGSWGGQKTAMTGLAILTFLAHGERPGAGEFSKTVQSALEYLIKNQRSDGRFNGMDGNQYAHPIATYALCEAFGMTDNPNVKEAAMKALDPIIKGQHPTGGWTYKMAPGPEKDGKYRDDTSYMGWCAQALKAAKLSKVHHEGLSKAIKLAIKGFKKNAHPNGGFGYTAPAPGGGLTSVGTLSMLLLGAGRDKDVANGQKVIDTWTPTFSSMTELKPMMAKGDKMDSAKKQILKSGRITDAEKKFYNQSAQYYFYYATQCKFHQGGKHWEKWNKAMKKPYVKAQIIEKDAIKDLKGKDQDVGHWENVDNHSDRPVMDTCLAALQLMVYYRYLPTTSAKAVEAETEIVATSTTESEDIDVDSGNL